MINSNRKSLLEQLKQSYLFYKLNFFYLIKYFLFIGIIIGVTSGIISWLNTIYLLPKVKIALQENNVDVLATIFREDSSIQLFLTIFTNFGIIIITIFVLRNIAKDFNIPLDRKVINTNLKMSHDQIVSLLLCSCVIAIFNSIPLVGIVSVILFFFVPTIIIF